MVPDGSLPEGSEAGVVEGKSTSDFHTPEAASPHETTGLGVEEPKAPQDASDAEKQYLKMLQQQLEEQNNAAPAAAATSPAPAPEAPAPPDPAPTLKPDMAAPQVKDELTGQLRRKSNFFKTALKTLVGLIIGIH